MYAIIEESGRQYKVSSGDRIVIDRAVPDEGEKAEKTITFDRVLLVGGDGQPKVGSPIVSGASVTAEVLGIARGPKIDIVKHKRRKGYHKKQGHRQTGLQVRITGIKV